MENNTNSNQTQLIPVTKIIESPFEPQARRREKFKTKQGTQQIAELSESILANGLQQPILVRPSAAKQGFFEIVFGERRFLAHLLKGIAEISCFVRNLSDAEVIKLQYIENHNRLEPDPLDDAFTFSYLKTEKNYSVHDLSIEFKMSEGNVLRRLKLNDLIDAAKRELSDGRLPLGHAVYMAAFSPEVQKKIVDDEMAYGYEGREAGAVLTLAEFKQDVEMTFVRKLSDAPFDIRDERLHIKGLTCPSCTQRTGFEPKLYDDDLGKDDTCLNKACFEIKSNVNLKLKQAEIAEQNAATTGEAVEISNAVDPGKDLLDSELKKVPLVTTRSAVNKKELPIKGEILTNQEILSEPECEYSVLSLDIDKGRKVYVCRNDKCPVHHLETIAPEEISGPTDYELQRMEKDFQIDIAMTVRERVLAKAIQHFDGYNSFWTHADLVEKLIVQFTFLRFDYLRKIPCIAEEWKNFPKNCSIALIEKFVGELDSRRKDQLLFVCLFAMEGSMYAGGEYKSQSGIEKLAKSYAKIDYDRLDADVRVELAPEEFKAEAENYRDNFRKTPMVVPRFWWFDFELPD